MSATREPDAPENDPTWHVALRHVGESSQYIIVAPSAQQAFALALMRWQDGKTKRQRRRLPQLLEAAVFGPAAMTWKAETS